MADAKTDTKTTQAGHEKQGPHQSPLSTVQRDALRQHEENLQQNEEAIKEQQRYSSTSGQTSDPGREHQTAAGQASSGQTGVQTGQVGGAPVGSGQPIGAVVKSDANSNPNA